jgi:cell division protein ZapE
MNIRSLKEAFLIHCSKLKLKKNHEQIEIIEFLIKFYENNENKNNFLKKLFTSNTNKLGFYLHGGVGVGKTMILSFFYDFLTIPKQRLHFNEFMIGVHDFLHRNKDKSKNENLLELFAKDLKKKTEIIYFDEFQVTNIVDAMILGKLFESIFNQNIKAIFTSNVKIDDLYMDGLQRDQFLPFIKTIKNFCIECELIITNDYRKSGFKTLERFFYPLDDSTRFNINQLFREITKGKKLTSPVITVKGRSFSLNRYYEGVSRFDFKELCSKNLGAEDYITIAEKSKLIVLDNVPNFNNENTNEQQRFITLIDILYEKKIPILVSCEVFIDDITSSLKLSDPFKRTLSRLHELTSPNFGT